MDNNNGTDGDGGHTGHDDLCQVLPDDVAPDATGEHGAELVAIPGRKLEQFV